MLKDSGGLYKLDPYLKGAWFQSLNLLVSKCAFKCNLYHYTAAPRS
jgi:hypothetical protein